MESFAPEKKGIFPKMRSKIILANTHLNFGLSGNELSISAETFREQQIEISHTTNVCFPPPPPIDILW